MALVLAIEPDARQRRILKWVIEDLVCAEFIASESKEAAVVAMASRIPDLILVSALIPPRDEAELGDHFRHLHGAEHLQILTIPLLASRDDERALDKRTGFLKSFLRKRPTTQPSGCDPVAYADELKNYLKPALEERSERAARRPVALVDEVALKPPIIVEEPVFALSAIEPVEETSIDEIGQPPQSEYSGGYEIPDVAAIPSSDESIGVEQTLAEALPVAEPLPDLPAYVATPEPAPQIDHGYKVEAPAEEPAAASSVDETPSHEAAAFEPVSLDVETDKDIAPDHREEPTTEILQHSYYQELFADRPAVEEAALEPLSEEPEALTVTTTDEATLAEPEPQLGGSFIAPLSAEPVEPEQIVAEAEEQDVVLASRDAAVVEEPEELLASPTTITTPIESAEQTAALAVPSAAKLLEDQLAELLASDLELAPRLIQIPPDESDEPDDWSSSGSVAAVVEELIRPMSEAVEPSESMVIEVVEDPSNWSEEQTLAIESALPSQEQPVEKPTPEFVPQPAAAVQPEKPPGVEAWQALPDWSHPWPALGSHVSVPAQPPTAPVEAAQAREDTNLAPPIEPTADTPPGLTIDGGWLARAFDSLRSDIQLLRQPHGPNAPADSGAREGLKAPQTRPPKKSTIQKRRHLKKRPDKRIREWGLDDGVFLTVDAFLAGLETFERTGAGVEPQSHSSTTTARTDSQHDWAGGSRRGWLAPWVRSEPAHTKTAEPVPQTMADDLRMMLSDLELPVAVASMTYPTGCQIQRIRMNRGKRSHKSAADANDPVIILSRRTSKPDEADTKDDQPATTETR